MPAIHAFNWRKTWMAATSAAMTGNQSQPRYLLLILRVGRGLLLPLRHRFVARLALRLFGRFLRRLLGLTGRALGSEPLLHKDDRPDRALVEDHQRQRQRELAEHIGRREHGRDHEGADDEIAPLLLELFGGQNTDAA